jgi:Ssp1 endopeptidase immunity protein Rap1a
MLAPLLALALIQPANDVPENNKGSQLYEQCRATMREQDGAAKPGDAMESTSCVAYIHGFLDGLVLIAQNHAICASGATFATMARVYVGWMEKNPSLWMRNRSSG